MNATAARWLTRPILITALQRELLAAGRLRDVAFGRPSSERKLHPQRMRAINVQEPPDTGDHQPSQSDRVNAAWQQLQLVLSFFPRVDTKLSVGLGINLGMLAMIATRLPKLDEFSALISIIGVLFLAPLTVSFWHLWWGYFPDLRGGTDSLIYFGRVASLSEPKFLDACSSRSLKELEQDILSQCWRNSQILSLKFESLKQSYHTTAIAIAPWMALISVLPPPPK
ncbi:DUF5706 domain-containing protein [Stenotrophomonas maltophilia]|nr:Pycsar system effector family protein [Stenotrophomonas maltophilia]MCI1058773.1 DUF5706 domain-containing protein [Stenotrophomonas maltophilia]MCI1062240.1 DUF5706 domain-containing protein [Stenotrophomonas maltophilia]MCI1079797.1 DUF5706 domain-containing protein [Stenotrophomonas maltophilia]MCI1082946.1 DUF5706 domain-containing protein [Stenotrophomonas maltophilia]MCI1095269.1 DUF5706 domain-containing protein [Stenotrophomonas maltophilia]